MSWSFANHPEVQAYLAAHPNSVFASRLAKFFHISSAPAPNTTGSNNAVDAGLAPPTGQTPNTPSAGGARIGAPRFGGGGGGFDTAGASYGAGFGMSGMGSNPGSNNMIPSNMQSMSFKEGGMMSQSGTAIRPGAPMQNATPTDEPQMGADEPMPMDGRQIEQEAQRFVQANPQVAQQVQAVIQHAMQTGELTYGELNTAVQLAKAALANPASYPQIRAFAIKNGLGTEADLPQAMDRGLLFTLLLAGKALQSSGGNAPAQGNVMPQQGQPKGGILPEYSDGGMTGDKQHLAVLHPEEYVVPRDVVLYHGKKHLDKLVEAARTPKDDSAGM